MERIQDPSIPSNAKWPSPIAWIDTEEAAARGENPKENYMQLQKVEVSQIVRAYPWPLAES